MMDYGMKRLYMKNLGVESEVENAVRARKVKVDKMSLFTHYPVSVISGLRNMRSHRRGVFKSVRIRLHHEE